MCKLSIRSHELVLEEFVFTAKKPLVENTEVTADTDKPGIAFSNRPYSLSRKVGNTIFVSGQIGVCLVMNS